jgi:hypothetical protein
MLGTENATTAFIGYLHVNSPRGRFGIQKIAATMKIVRIRTILANNPGVRFVTNVNVRRAFRGFEAQRLVSG